jgi:hypothetical protein
MIARIELGAGVPAELVRLLPLLGLKPVLLEPIPAASVITPDYAMASDSALAPDSAGSASAPTAAMAVALRVEFGMYRRSRGASPAALTIAISERNPALEPIAETAAATADFVCDSSIAAACFILARALRLASPILTTNARLFEVIRAAVAIAHGPAGVLVEGEIGVGKESLIKMIHAASGDPASLIYAECAGLEAASVAAEIAPLLAQAGGPNRDADPDYDARLPGAVRHDADGSQDADGSDDAHDAGDANSTDRLHRDDAIGSARGASRADDLNSPTSPSGGTIFFNHLGEPSLAAQRNLLDLIHATAPAAAIHNPAAPALAAAATTSVPSSPPGAPGHAALPLGVDSPRLVQRVASAGQIAPTDFQNPADRALATSTAAPVVQGPAQNPRAAQNPDAEQNPEKPALRTPFRRPPDSFAVRLLAASAHPLAAMVARGEFLAELHQLFDATLTLTPLRDRPGDLPMLVRHALRMLNPALTLDAAAIRTLARYPFPGNLRELTNFVTRLAIVPAKSIPRHLSASVDETATIGRAEVIRQLDHPSLKLLWRSRHQRAAGLRSTRRARQTPVFDPIEHETPPDLTDLTLVTHEFVPVISESMRLTTSTHPHRRTPRGVPKFPT